MAARGFLPSRLLDAGHKLVTVGLVGATAFFT
jgi:hypothetical protein